ncbi:LacI family transcriptional regulator [Bosea caraganae]|uniref:LacI family transcriptional regulator n=1 Tax=Bosea caraganae TaxID=2763117 RepID=A0A370L1B7_9HYPH|nr:LacI family DNA-binding transcriptional regulator [Bosea caraganae]RDJ21317.1 LacI family transcriptional regulator [Bosea caraganae]RDJ26457.1 LacI family transcriptional regulator [Bosea caraganae]
MSTINDVAKLARVSISTVSNVLNGRTDRMSKDTFARVEKAVTELGYQPNRAARQLKTGEAALIGLLVPSLTNPSYGALAREIEAEAWESYGYRVVVSNTYRDPRNERAFLDDMLTHGIRGVIIISSLADESHIEEVVRKGLVAISYDSQSQRAIQPVIDHVSSDNVAGGRMAAEYLIANGHRCIAFLTPRGWTFSRAQKREGFMLAVEAAGIRGVVIEGALSSNYADEELAELGMSLAGTVAEHPERPTGIVAINDIMAVGLLAGLRKRGMAIPADVSVVGMDGIALGTFVAPPLTSVRLATRDMAKAMVDRIMLRLKRGETTPSTFRFPPTMLVRESVAGPPLRR